MNYAVKENKFKITAICLATVMIFSAALPVFASETKIIAEENQFLQEFAIELEELIETGETSEDDLAEISLMEPVQYVPSGLKSSIEEILF